jgi:hypothetical protein
LALSSAVLMGGAVAFFFFAMPMVLIEQGVIASGLPTLIASAGPPLGATARTLVAATFALLAGGVTWLVITGIGMIGSRPVRDPREADESLPVDIQIPVSAPPVRRPIFASELVMSQVEERHPEIEEAVFTDAWSDEEMPIFPTDDVLDLVEPIADKVPEPQPEPKQQPEPEPEVEAENPLPIAELMARLEAGALRRSEKKQVATVVTQETDHDRPSGFDGALRDALEELQRMATR